MNMFKVFQLLSNKSELTEAQKIKQEEFMGNLDEEKNLLWYKKIKEIALQSKNKILQLLGHELPEEKHKTKMLDLQNERFEIKQFGDHNVEELKAQNDVDLAEQTAERELSVQNIENEVQYQALVTKKINRKVRVRNKLTKKYRKQEKALQKSSKSIGNQVAAVNKVAGERKKENNSSWQLLAANKNLHKETMANKNIERDLKNQKEQHEVAQQKNQIKGEIDTCNKNNKNNKVINSLKAEEFKTKMDPFSSQLTKAKNLINHVCQRNNGKFKLQISDIAILKEGKLPTQFSMLLQSLEKTIENVEAFVEENEESFTKYFVNYTSEIKEFQKNIEKIKKEISDIKNLKIEDEKEGEIENENENENET